jgi:hypothetical protein
MLMVAQIEPSDVAWAVAVAVAAWILGLGIVLLLSRKRGGSALVPLGLSSAGVGERPSPASPNALAPAAIRDAEDIAGVLRWLLSETQAESGAFLRLSPGGDERLVVEPRGLDPTTVTSLAQRAREALVRSTNTSPATSAATRWLGSGGSKALVLQGTAAAPAAEPLQFARFAIEWMEASRKEEPVGGLEDQVRAVPGVAWAELTEDSPGAMRVLLAENVDRNMVNKALENAVSGTGVALRLVQPTTQEEQARARLLGITVDADGQASAEVRLDWKGQELRGRGYGAASPAGRHHAAAHAVADALRPLLASDVVVEGLYAHAHRETELLVVVVSVDEERLVGAVPESSPERHVGAALAVLDAVNRRLSRIAGGSGRI